MMSLLIFAVFTITISVFLLSIGKYFFWSYPFELLTHFQVQYFWLLIIASFVGAICWWQGKFDSRIIILVWLFTLVLNLVEILPWYLSKQQIVAKRSDVLRVMSFNICGNNTDTLAIVRSIRAVNPDVVMLVEVSPTMMEQITVSLESEFPARFRSPGGGLGILSKLPLKSAQGENFAGSDATNLVASILLHRGFANEYHQREIKIIGTHPMVPKGLDLFNYRNQHLQAISNYVKGTQESVILLGDFNLTPWSPYYRQLVQTTDLHNTRMGFGILPTWTRSSSCAELPNWLIPILNIPIDHIFVSKDFQVVRTYTGENGNSDHAPIISELAIYPANNDRSEVSR
jgi:endonuclease/exonuclease/phosphatase (EEP) superfamily protein YafD